MTKPSTSTNCPHCFRRNESLPGASSSSRSVKWLLVILVAAAAFFAGWSVNAPQVSVAGAAQDRDTGVTAIPQVRRNSTRTPAKTLDELLARAKVENGGEIENASLVSQSSFEKGKLYILGVSIHQVGSAFLLAGSPSKSRGYFEFEEQALESIALAEEDACYIVGRFNGYKQVPLVSGATERCPAFELVALDNRSRGSFHSFE
jgi:hypothetical protein